MLGGQYSKRWVQHGRARGQVGSGGSSSFELSTHHLRDSLSLLWGHVGPGHSTHWFQSSPSQGQIKIKLKKSSGKKGWGEKANRARGYETNWKRELFVPFELPWSKKNSYEFWVRFIAGLFFFLFFFLFQKPPLLIWSINFPFPLLKQMFCLLQTLRHS